MSELDKTIEELEAEVLAELEEANGADAPKKGAMPAQKSEIDDETEEDLGGDAADGTKAADGAAKSADKVKPAKKVASVAPMKPEKLAAGDEVDHDGDDLVEEEETESEEELSEARMTKEMMKKEMAHKMEGMKAVDLRAAYEMMMKNDMQSEESNKELKALEDAKAEIEEKIKSISVKEDVDALTEGEELSEEFKEKAATVFEAAVKSKMRSEVERIVEAVNSEKETEMETFKDELTEKVDTYLNYVVETWSKENELAIERGLKGEIAEDFISGLKQLFEDHYIDVPDEKYDVLEAQSEKIAELEEKLNEEIQKNVDMSQQNSGLVREQMIAEVSEDLADTEIEKFKSLTDDVEFVDEESFKEKLNTLKESYFPKTQPSSSAGTSVDDENGGTAQDVDTTDAMKAYMSAISRDHKASA
jgi:hypothetical protein